jgi:hypothetical protein
MIMDYKGRGKSLGSGTNSLVLGEYRLEFNIHRGCLNNMNGVELGDNSIMTLFEEIFNLTGTKNLKGSYCDALELILFSLLLELHV